MNQKHQECITPFKMDPRDGFYFYRDWIDIANIKEPGYLPARKPFERRPIHALSVRKITDLHHSYVFLATRAPHFVPPYSSICQCSFMAPQSPNSSAQESRSATSTVCLACNMVNNIPCLTISPSSLPHSSFSKCTYSAVTRCFIASSKCGVTF